MKRVLIAVSIFSSLFLLSCRKESTLSGSGSGGGTEGTRLVKLVNKAGQDSSVSEFSYTSSGKITSFKASGVESGQAIDLRISYIRNSSGIIQKQILKGNDFISIGIDSIVTIVNYDAANNRYKNAVSVFSAFRFNIRDSLVFNYDLTGKLITEIDYTDQGSGYKPATKTEYGYTGTNLLSEKFYLFNTITSGFTLKETDTYEHDDKKNPLQFASEAAVLNMNPFYSTNNITKATGIASDPADNFVSTETYTYNSSNRPATSINVTGTDTSATTYYYQ